jgi:TonB family protein
MKKAARRRHLLFFSTSLFAHLLFVLILVGVCLVVSDTPPVGEDRPLVISLDGRGSADDATAIDKTREKTPALRTGPAPSDAIPTEESADYSVSGGAITPGGTGDAALLSGYIGRIHTRINRYKRYPPGAARGGIEGTVTVSFLLARNGALLEKGIVAGSGNRALDEAALATVADASPFPPFPEGLDRETLRLKLPINYRQR